MGTIFIFTPILFLFYFMQKQNIFSRKLGSQQLQQNLKPSIGLGDTKTSQHTERTRK